VQIELTATRDRGYVRRLVRDGARPHIQFWYAYLAGSLAVTGVCFLSRNGQAIFGGVLNLVLIGLAWRWLYTPTRKQWREPAAHLLQPRHVSMTPEGVRVTSMGVLTAFPWEFVKRADERAYAFVLRTEDGAYRDLPRDSMTAEQAEQLRSFLAGRGLLRSA